MKRWVVLLLGLTGCSQKLASGIGTDNGGTGVASCAPTHHCVADGGAWFDGMAVFQIGAPEEIEQTTCPRFAPHAGAVLYGDLGDTSYMV